MPPISSPSRPIGRQAGFGYLEAGIGLGLVVGTAFALWWAYSSGAAAGRAEERAAWQDREIAQQAAYKAKLEEIRGERDQALGRLQTELATADAEHLKTKENLSREKAKNDRTAADLRAARLVLRDRAATANPPGRSERPADTPTACRGDGNPAQPGNLSQELSAALWSEAARADEVVEDLEAQLGLAQNAVGAYYRIARDCVAGN